MRRLVVAGVCVVLLAACAPGSSAAQPAPQPAQKQQQETVASYFAPPQAFPGPRWTRNGRAVADGELNSIAGPEHCGWQSAVMMHVGWPLGTASTSSTRTRQYLRDPNEVIGHATNVAAELPSDAEDTGYRNGGLQLWLSPSEPDAAYLRAGDDVERWPRADPVRACA